MSSRKVISTERAPAAVGPYSQAIRAGDWLFVSGQIPIDPSTGQIAGGGETPVIEAQTRQVLDNLGAVLEAGGASFGSIVKTTIYLTNMDHFATVNAIYAERVGEQPPARACVGVGRLPKEALVEMDAVALVG